MKFGIAKLAQSFYTSTKKKFKCKKKQKHKELSSIEDKKAKQIFVTKEKKILFNFANSVPSLLWAKGALPPILVY